MVSRKFREMPSHIKMPVKRKYFQAVGKCLIYDPETGLWQ